VDSLTADRLGVERSTIPSCADTGNNLLRTAALPASLKGVTAKAIAAALPERPTATAVQDALALDRAMRDRGLATPYVNVLAPPEDYSKLRRHKNPKYRFIPLEGHLPPEL
jgi:hypothetical protein